MNDEYLSSSFFSTSNLLTTIFHNAVVNREIEGYPERYVFSQNLDPANVEEFRKLVELSSFDYLTSLDDWMVGHASKTVAGPTENVSDDSEKVGVGIYFFKASEN